MERTLLDVRTLEQELGRTLRGKSRNGQERVRAVGTVRAGQGQAPAWIFRMIPHRRSHSFCELSFVCTELAPLPVQTVGCDVGQWGSGVLQASGVETVLAGPEMLRLLDLVGIASPQALVQLPVGELPVFLRKHVLAALALAQAVHFFALDVQTGYREIGRVEAERSISEMQGMMDIAILLCTADPARVESCVDQVAVTVDGQVVEYAQAGSLLRHPFHPYTQALLSAQARSQGGAARGGRCRQGCRFHERCPLAFPRCAQKEPPLFWVGSSQVRCWDYQRIAEVV